MNLYEIAYGLTLKALECEVIMDDFDKSDVSVVSKATAVCEFFNTIVENLNTPTSDEM